MHKAFTPVLVAAALLAGLLARPFFSSPAFAGAPASAPALVASAQAAPSLQSNATGSVHTSGSAVIRIQPDRASIRFGVQTFGSSPRSSQAENEAIVKKVYQAIRDQGVEAKDIGTDFFSVRPEYNYSNRSKPELLGYWSENAIGVTLRDVSKLSDVLVAALDAGATAVDDLTFSTTRLRELRDQARAMAVQAAMEKAQALAGAAHISTGSVRSIQEESWSYYYGRWNNRGHYMNQVQNVMQEAPPSDTAPEIDDGEFSLGQIVVQAQVDVNVETR